MLHGYHDSTVKFDNVFRFKREPETGHGAAILVFETGGQALSSARMRARLSKRCDQNAL